MHVVFIYVFFSFYLCIVIVEATVCQISRLSGFRMTLRYSLTGSHVVLWLVLYWGSRILKSRSRTGSNIVYRVRNDVRVFFTLRCVAMRCVAFQGVRDRTSRYLLSRPRCVALCFTHRTDPLPDLSCFRVFISSRFSYFFFFFYFFSVSSSFFFLHFFMTIIFYCSSRFAYRRYFSITRQKCGIKGLY